MKTPFQLLVESGVPVLLVGGHALHVYRYTCAPADLEATCLRYGPPGIFAQLKNIRPYENPQP